MSILYRFTNIIFLILTVSACAPITRHALPEKYINVANPVGFSKVRDWGTKPSRTFQADLEKSIRQRLSYESHLSPFEDNSINVLALSGGGSYGAFSVGILSGWTAKGTRPEFQLVTGISTGAIIAPFAFIGSQYDEQIRYAYTNMSTKDILRRKYLAISLVSDDSFSDSAPLKKLIAKNINYHVMQQVAKAYKQGRRLYIGTTNLDAHRLVIWNMGAIAASHQPHALALFQKIILASASIPVAFPPVMIKVIANNKIYDEMHVDGGVTTEVFFYGQMLDINKAVKAAGLSKVPKIRIYIIRNNQLEPSYHPVDRKVFSIAGRALSGLTTSQGVGDLYRIYTIAQKDHIDFNLTYIPASFEPEYKETFDREDMRRLYQLGFNIARYGNPWEKLPPGFTGNLSAHRTLNASY